MIRPTYSVVDCFVSVSLCSLLIVMSVVGLVPTWMTITIVIREYIVMGIRSYAAAEGFVLSAQFWGKLKTIALFPGVLLVLLNIPYSVYVIALAVIMAAVSGIDYALKVSRYISGRSMSPESS